MSNLLNTILISFSQLLFSSRALALMANQVSSQTLRTSRAAGAETQGGSDYSPIHESSSDIADQAQYTCACGSIYEVCVRYLLNA